MKQENKSFLSGVVLGFIATSIIFVFLVWWAGHLPDKEYNEGNEDIIWVADSVNGHWYLFSVDTLSNYIIKVEQYKPHIYNDPDFISEQDSIVNN